MFFKNQRAHVLACVLSVAAAFCDVMSIQKIQEQNCGTLRCREEIYNTKNFKYEEPFYPPFFLYHYIAFVSGEKIKSVYIQCINNFIVNYI